MNEREFTKIKKTMRKKPLILLNEFFSSNWLPGVHFKPCLSQPNKFVIVVYITDMIFTLYRCDDWQISFLFDSTCVCALCFLCFGFDSPIPMVLFSFFRLFWCISIQWAENDSLRLPVIDSVFLVIKSKPYVKRWEQATRCKTLT